MKVVFEFDTSAENFNRRELEEFQNAPKLVSALGEIRQAIRNMYKYYVGCEDDNPTLINTEKVRMKFFEILKDNGIDGLIE